MMFDKRSVYLMIRTRNNEAEIIRCRTVLNARKIESKLHKRFSSSRFVMTRKIRFNKWFQHHVKIGIAKNPKLRNKQVTKDIFDSGKTEWFAINDVELSLLLCFLWYYHYKLKIQILFTITSIILLINLTGFEVWKKLMKELFF